MVCCIYLMCEAWVGFGWDRRPGDMRISDHVIQHRNAGQETVTEVAMPPDQAVCS